MTALSVASTSPVAPRIFVPCVIVYSFLCYFHFAVVVVGGAHMSALSKASTHTDTLASANIRMSARAHTRAPTHVRTFREPVHRRPSEAIARVDDGVEALLVVFAVCCCVNQLLLRRARWCAAFRERVS